MTALDWLKQTGDESAQKNCASETKENGRVSLVSLSEMTGFPVEFIQKELMIDADDLSMNDLRASVATFLNKSFVEVQ